MSLKVATDTTEASGWAAHRAQMSRSGAREALVEESTEQAGAKQKKGRWRVSATTDTIPKTERHKAAAWLGVNGGPRAS